MSLTSFDCEISNGGLWVSLNDGVKFKVSGEGTRDGSQVSWRKIVATSPVMEGEYLVHAVKGEVMENLAVYVYGATHAELNTNVAELEDLFSQFSYQVRWTMNGAVETWDCHVAEYGINRANVYSHAQMAVFSAQVPRLPDPTYS